MKFHRVLSHGPVAVAMASVLSLVTLSVAQNGAPTGKPSCTGCSVDGKTTPRSSDGHPDLNGLWGAVGSVATDIASRAADGSTLYDFSGGQVGPDGRTLSSTPVTDSTYEGFGIDTKTYNDLSEPSYKPEYATKVKAMVDKDQYGSSSGADPMFACKPLGVPRGAVGTMQVVQTPQVTAFLYELQPGPVFRLIYTDGRAHPKPDDLDTSFLGDSIGHWEGDTLVVDTIGLNDETWLGGGFAGPKYARIHSDQEHVIERWTRDGDTLTYEATVEDPVMLTKPWVITPRHIRHSGPDGRIFNDPCVGKDEGHIVKPTKDDQFVCNYCKTTRTPATGSTAPAKKP